MNPVIAQAVQTVAIPTAWFWPSMFGLVLAIIAYFLKGKFDRWDKTSTVVHEHTTHLTMVNLRLQHMSEKMEINLKLDRILDQLGKTSEPKE